MSLCGDVKTLVEAASTRPLKILPNECLESSRWEFDLKNYVIIGGQPQRRRPSYCEVECFLPPYARRSKSLDTLIPILDLKGVSTGDFAPALAALLGKDGPGLSAATIARLKDVWFDEHKRWSERDLSAKSYVYVWADGVYLQARLEDEAQCILVIIGATPEDRKELLGFVDGARESAHDWRALLLDLKRRGLSMAPKVAVADGALGFWKAIGEVWSRTREQRCWVHKTANILNKLPKSQQPRAKRMLQRLPGRTLEAPAHVESDRKHLRDRPTQDDPLEGMPLEQDRARHGLQVGRRRAEDLASP